MWDVIGELVRTGVTIFLTTQYLDEADRLADRVAVLDHGRIVAEGTPDELKRRVPGGHISLHFVDPQTRHSAARALRAAAPGAETAALQVPGDGSPASLRALLSRLDAVGIEPERISIHDADLDDVFLALTGHPTDQPDAQK
jgi:ABC-2 type transport system ATP-binding protein